MQRIWVTGYRNYELGTFGDKDPIITVIKYAIKNYLRQLLEDGQLDWVITGGQLGVEQWTVETALELRAEYDLRVAMMVPYMNFSSRWSEGNQLKFQELRDQVDFFAPTSREDYRNGGQLRAYQHFMFDHTDRAMMVYDPEHPGKTRFDYDMVKQYEDDGNDDYPLDLIDMYDLEDAANEYEESHRKW